MAAKNRSDIIHEIEEHIIGNGGKFGEWFVGTTDNPKHRLFTVHKVRTTGDGWICRRAFTDLQALEVESYFRSVRKTGGRNSSSNINSFYVYAYKMKPHTNP